MGESLRRTHKPVALKREELPLECLGAFERFLAVPILEGDRVTSVAAVGNKGFDYDETDMNQFQLLMTGAWNQIKRNEATAWIQHEVDEIANIQRALLPRTMPSVQGMRVRAFSSTFDRAGGDYYDMLPVGAVHENDLKNHPLWLIFVADASGHGPSAAVVVAMLSILLRVRCERAESPAKLLGYLNERLMERTFGQSFITAFLGIINLRERILTYSNAGQNAPLMRTADGTITELAGTGDIPLSVRSSWSFSEQRIGIPPQSTLWLYTDGVVETLSPKGEAFGDARLCEAIRHVEGESSSAVADLVSMLRAHEAGRRPSDDQVIMLVEFK